jgi:hypothetical protein
MSVVGDEAEFPKRYKSHLSDPRDTHVTFDIKVESST